MKCKNCHLLLGYRNTSGFCRDCRMTGNKLAKGREKTSRGENHPRWRGDSVGYDGLHKWVRKYLPRPALCEHCAMAPPLDLANKGTYSREFANWEWLCRRCHMLSDGRLKVQQ